MKLLRKDNTPCVAHGPKDHMADTVFRETVMHLLC